jgi:hypothetical protein
MFFLNLSVTEFLALFGALGGLITALYMFDRSKRRRVVSTLQFWSQGGASQQNPSRKRMQDPWSLILQLIGLLLLLLAIAQMQWGKRTVHGRDHVILLDASAWSEAPVLGSKISVLEEERRQTRAYLSSLNGVDRAMLVVLDGQATPVVRFTREYQKIESTLEGIRPGLAATNLNDGVTFASEALKWFGGEAGEIVYIGPQMLTGDLAKAVTPHLRVIPVPADRNNLGIEQFTVQQIEGEANSWRSIVKVKNYGTKPSTSQLSLHYGNMSFRPRLLNVGAGSDITVTFVFTTKSEATLEAALNQGGTLTSDDKAGIVLPQTRLPKLFLYSDRPEILRPLVTGNQFESTIYPTARFTPRPDADLLLLDRFAPSNQPERPALWIDPPKDGSPLVIQKNIKNSELRWSAASSMDSALHAKTLHVSDINVLQVQPSSDEVIASIPEGPAIVTRNAGNHKPRLAIVGFDPAQGQLRFEVATPLLFAHIIRWLSPQAFREVTISAEKIGVLSVPLDAEERHHAISVTDDRGTSVPFSRDENSVRIFADHFSRIHIASSIQERVISVQLPIIAETFWKTPSEMQLGQRAKSPILPAATNLWKWLAVLGGLCGLLEWFLYGRMGAKNRWNMNRIRVTHSSSKQARAVTTK